MGVICRLLFLPYTIVFLQASEFQVKLAIGTWIIGIVMSRCIFVNEENLVVGGSTPRNLGISGHSCLLFGRNGAPNQFLCVQ